MSRLRSQPRGRTAFTLIELLVVIAIIAILIGLLLPAIQKVRDAAARAQSQNNLKQMGLAVNNIAGTYNGALPPSYGLFPTGGQIYGSFFFHILPFIEQQNVYTQYSAAASLGTNVQVTIKTYVAPADPTNSTSGGTAGLDSYTSNLLVFGPTSGTPGSGSSGTGSLPATFVDGTSNTLIVAESYANANSVTRYWSGTSTYFQATPGGPNYAITTPAKLSASGVTPPQPTGLSTAALMVGMADGSVRSVTSGTSQWTFYLACNPQDGYPMGSDW
jgi:prepilin-type N-terminal cleavage/methylation domain-containing protein